MPNIVLDGISVLYTNAAAIVLFIFTLLGLGLFLTGAAWTGDWEAGGRVLAAIPAGLALLVPLSFLLMLAGYFQPAVLKAGSFLILAAACGLLIHAGWTGRLKTGQSGIILLGFFVPLLLVRLSYLRYVLLPAYSDSTVHYEIISSFLKPGLDTGIRQPLAHIFSNYYHYGYHSITAWLSLVLGLPVERAMLLVGQLTLAILPISIYVLAHDLTRSAAAAAVASLLAAFGWAMPAFAVNWGKYPALAALSIAPAVLALVLRLFPFSRKKPGALVAALLLLAGSTLLHSRVLICLVFAAAGLLAALRLESRAQIPLPQAVRLSIIFLIGLFPLYPLVLEFYAGIPLILALLLLLPFAFHAYPRITTAIFFFVFLLWLALKLPTFFIRSLQPLMDQQFVGMVLYIPLSLLGGLGLKGLLDILPAGRPWRWAAMALLVIAVLGNFQRGSLYPDPCCDYFRPDDEKAVQWINAHTPEGSLFLISAYGGQFRSVGSDGGIWIHPLTGRATNKLPYDLDWSSKLHLEELCPSGAKDVFIYSGGRPDSFLVDPTMSAGALHRVFKAGQVEIFRVTSCHP